MRPPLSILTVGDGDLSSSLALLRAYQPRGVIRQLIATTLLPNRTALVETYPTSAPAILQELESMMCTPRTSTAANNTTKVTILYGVDATQLHVHSELLTIRPGLDLILFHHPHLGYPTSADNQSSSEEHALRHAALLAHYFHSASQLLGTAASRTDRVPASGRDVNYGGCIHLCLCHGAIIPWQLSETIQHLNLECVYGSPFAASRPLLEPVLSSCEVEKVWEDQSRSQTNDRRNNENNRHKRTTGAGSRKGHWLGKYGYRHQPTFPGVTEFKTNVSSSYHYFVRPPYGTNSDIDNGAQEAGPPRSMDETKGNIPNTDGPPQHECRICRQLFSSASMLQEHVRSPAMPRAPSLQTQNDHRS